MANVLRLWWRGAARAWHYWWTYLVFGWVLLAPGLWPAEWPVWAKVLVGVSYYAVLIPFIFALADGTPDEVREEATERAVAQERAIDDLASRLDPGWASLGLNRVHALVRAGKSGEAAGVHRAEVGVTWDQAHAAVAEWEASGFVTAKLELLTQRLAQTPPQELPLRVTSR